VGVLNRLAQTGRRQFHRSHGKVVMLSELRDVPAPGG
jgi:hypothetical protein